MSSLLSHAIASAWSSADACEKSISSSAPASGSSRSTSKTQTTSCPRYFAIASTVRPIFP